MQAVVRGAAGLKATPLAYGTWQSGGDWGPEPALEQLAAPYHWHLPGR